MPANPVLKLLPPAPPTPVTRQETRPAAPPVFRVQARPGTRPPDAMVGRYIVLERVGAGGMGQVLRAYDPKLQREVALKLVHRHRLGDDTEARVAAARAVAEARAMASLAHPNVVAVYDVDERADRPGDGVVLVMQYIAGNTLEQWRERGPRSWREIVELYRQAGAGLAAAHAKGILHRDFKPANVLVAPDGTAKVTDFGIALLAGAENRPTSSATAGTPLFMAPEQHRGEPLGATVDQYAFCVALWRSLTGEAPFARTALLARKEQGPPAWPATCSNVSRGVASAIRRGLAPCPIDRWPNMDALLAALARAARPQRRRGISAAVAVAAVAAIAVAAAVPTALGTNRARCADGRAQLAEVWNETRRHAIASAFINTRVPYAAHTWSGIEPQLEGYAQGWTAMYTETCTATAVRGDQPAAVMDLRIACLRRARDELTAAVELFAEADAQVVEKAHQVAAALPDLSACADVDALRAGVPPPHPEEASTVAAIRSELSAAHALLLAGKYDRVGTALRRIDGWNANIAYAPVATEIDLLRGILLERTGDFPGSEAALRRALAGSLRLRQAALAGRAAGLLLFVVGYQAGDGADGLAYRYAAEGLTRGDAKLEGIFRKGLGVVLERMGDLTHSEQEQRRAVELLADALGASHPTTMGARNDLANVHKAQGRYAEAEAEHRQLLALRTELLGPNHPELTPSLNGIASTLYVQDRVDEVEPVLRRAAAVLAASAPDHPSLAVVRGNIALVLRFLGKYQESADELLAILRDFEGTLGRDHIVILNVRNNLAFTRLFQSAYAEAEQLARENLDRLLMTAPQSEIAGDARTHLGNALYGQGRHREALRQHELAVAHFEAILPAHHPRLPVARADVARDLGALGRFASAEAQFRAIIHELEGSPGNDLAWARQELASILLERGRSTEALELAEKASQYFRTATASPDCIAKINAVVARALSAQAARRSGATRRRLLRRARDLATEAAQICSDPSLRRSPGCANLRARPRRHR